MTAAQITAQQDRIDHLLHRFRRVGRVNITRDYPTPNTILTDVEILEVGPGRALLDEPRRGGQRGQGWIDTSTVTAVWSHQRCRGFV